MKQHDLFRLFISSSCDDYKINYLNLFHEKLENDLEIRQFEKDFQFIQEIALLLYKGGIKKSYIDVRVKYDHNTEFDFLFACKVKTKECLVNIELTQKNDLDLKDDKKIDQLKRHNKFLSQFYSQYEIITILVNKINDSKNYFFLDNDELQEFNLGQTKYGVEWDSNFELEDTTVINDFQCEWLTHEQYNTFKEIEKLDSNIKFVWLKGNAGCGKTAIGLKLYRKNSKTILLKCAEVIESEEEKGIVNFTTFMNKNKGKVEQDYDFLIVDECQSIVSEQLQYIKENISKFDHIIFIGDENQNHLQKREWGKYLKEISSNEEQFKEIVLNEYLRQNEDTIKFFEYLCFDKSPKTRVMYPKFRISRYSFEKLPSLKHNWNTKEYNKEVVPGRAIGKTYKNAEIIMGKEFCNQKTTMNSLYVLLTRTPDPIICFQDEDTYKWFIDKYYNYINEFIDK